MRTVRYVVSIFFVAVLLLTAFAMGFLAHRWMVEQTSSQPLNMDDKFSVFWEAWNIAQQHFVDPKALDSQDMIYGATRGMLDALGDRGHTRFLTPQELAAEESSIAGSYSGIGAEIGIQDGRTIIVSPFDGSPAQEAGLQPGDVIVRVDGQDVGGLSLDQIVSRVKGPEGTSVTLSLFRQGNSSLVEVTIVRRTVRVAAVSWAMIPGTSLAHIRISQFSENALPDLKSALADAKAEGALGLVLDVRNNPGGLLDQAISVTSQFLADGNVTLERDRNGNEHAHRVEPGGMALDTPLVVLVNEGSASASEIFAGALQDYERATVIGEPTFGTGTILSTFYLRDGSAILLGTGEWLTPNGRSLRNQGITPDITVALGDGGRILSPTQTGEMTLAEIEELGDAQLLRGIQELTNRAAETGSAIPWPVSELSGSVF